jgi:hypothetical protein
MVGLSKETTKKGRLQRSCLDVLREHEADGAGVRCCPRHSRRSWSAKSTNAQQYASGLKAKSSLPDRGVAGHRREAINPPNCLQMHK